MARVFLNIGSNIDRDRHIVPGLDTLRIAFGSLELSSVYESESVGFEGDPFYNLAVVIGTSHSPGVLATILKRIEYKFGRCQNSKPNSSRTLDIDILTYDNMVGVVDGVTLPRPEILSRAYVLGPLAELRPELIHSSVGRSYSELWRDFKEAGQPLRSVDYFWHGTRISYRDDSVAHKRI